MTERYRDEEEREMLDKIESILADADGTEREADSLYGFAARLASTLPRPDDDFRRDLLVRLQSEMGHTPATTGRAAYRRLQAGTQEAKDGQRATEASATGDQPAQPRIKGPAGLLTPLRPIKDSLQSERRKRFSAAAMGLIGVAAMLLLFVGMAAMFRMRQDSRASTTAVVPAIAAAGSQTPAPQTGSLPSPQLLHTIEIIAPTQSMAWSPDGQMLATTGENTLEIWNTTTGQVLHSVAISNGAQGNTSRAEAGLAWSPDSRTVAVGTNASSVALIDPASGTVRSYLQFPPDTIQRDSDPAQGLVQNVAWSPDGFTLAATSDRHPILIFNVATGSVERRLGESNFTLEPNSLRWSADGHTLAVPDMGSYVMLRIDVASGIITRSAKLLPMPDGAPRPVPTQPVPGVEEPPLIDRATNPYGDVADVAWSPDLSMVALVQNKTIILWDVASGQELTRLPATPRSTGWTDRISWSPSSDFLASTGHNVTLWNLRTGEETVILPEQIMAWNLTWSPDSRSLAVGLQDANLSNKLLVFGIPSEPANARPTATATSNCGSWTILPSPNGGEINVLQSVDALSPDSAWAVGYYSNETIVDTNSSEHEGQGTRTLIQRWDGSRWTTVPSPNVGSGSNYLRSIAAISENDVWAVGFYSTTNNLERTLIQHWDGTEWRVIPSPNAGDNVDNRLAGVSAVSSDDVWVVGSYGDNYAFGKPTASPAKTLTMHWDGTEWKIVPSPNDNQTANRLYGVAAISTDEAWAVGYTRTPYGASPKEWTASALLLRWNGSEWQSDEGPQQATLEGFYQQNALGVAAVDKDAVWAVGADSSGPAVPGYDFVAPLLFGRERGKWSVATPVARPVLPTGQSHLSAVAAIAKNDLWAVGGYIPDEGTQGQAQTYALHYNGAAWGVVPSPNVMGEESQLLGVAAVARNDVWAVGYSGPHESHNTLIMRFTGQPCEMMPEGAGTPVAPAPSYPAPEQPPPTPAAPEPSPTTAASASNSVCGSWNIVDSPMVGTASTLQAVAAISSDDVWAVGSYTGESATAEDGSTIKGKLRTLTMHWDGKEWKVIPSPDGADGTNNRLTAVAARAKDDVWAVGYYGDSNDDAQRDKSRTLVLHWDGSRWEVVASPDVETVSNRLSGVVALAEDDVWAVGYHGGDMSADGRNIEPTYTLIQHWDGKEWKLVTSPNPGKYGNELSAVTAAGKGDIWAAGAYNTEPPGQSDNSTSQPLLLHWDGGTWSHVPSPPMESRWGALSAISARTKDDVWAVGSTGGKYALPLTMHWNGNSWSRIPGPQAPRPNNGLSVWLGAVTTLSPNQVWAVGGAVPFPYVVRWDGAAWSDAWTPERQADGRNIMAELAGVTSLSSGQVWAVGTQVGGNNSIILRYTDAPCPNP